MLRILIGACVALLTALALVTWELKGTWEDNRELEIRVRVAEAQSERLDKRFGALDGALLELSAETKANRSALARALESLKTITRQPEDSDETIECLDLPLPRDLDRILRGAAGDPLPAGDDS